VGAQSTLGAQSTMAAQSPVGSQSPSPTVGKIIGLFKSITTHRYLHGVKELGWLPFEGRLWQRNYYEHIVRNDQELENLRRYISENPLKWELDQENPQNNNERETGS